MCALAFLLATILFLELVNLLQDINTPDACMQSLCNAIPSDILYFGLRLILHHSSSHVCHRTPLF